MKQNSKITLVKIKENHFHMNYTFNIKCIKCKHHFEKLCLVTFFIDEKINCPKCNEPIKISYFELIDHLKEIDNKLETLMNQSKLTIAEINRLDKFGTKTKMLVFEILTKKALK